jgi:hypothetical protein
MTIEEDKLAGEDDETFGLVAIEGMVYRLVVFVVELDVFGIVL